MRRSTAIVCAFVSVGICFVAAGCGDDGPTDSGDVEPPARVEDLVAVLVAPSAVELRWTTPGDNGLEGRASFFEVRRSASPLMDGTWSQALLIDAGRPKDSGQADTALVTGLESGAHYFGVRVSDEVPNWSPVSNSPMVDVPVVSAPDPIRDLRVDSSAVTSVLLRWTAPSGAESGVYDVRYSESGLDSLSWDDAGEVANEPTPGTAGTEESLEIDGLTPGVDYSFAIRVASSQQPTWSALSNVVVGRPAGVLQLTSSPRTSFGVRDPSWSPAGTRIAFAADWQSTIVFRLYTVPAIGGPPTLYTNVPRGTGPDWDPTSSRLVFVSEEPDVLKGSAFFISIIDADPNADHVPLVSHEPKQVASPVWSPNGQDILYVAAEFPPPMREIFLTSPTGTDPRLLLSADRNASSPSWSPDGSKFVVSMAGDLWIIEADGGAEEQITFGGGDDVTPDWSPNGEEIAFASNPTGNYDIWIVSLETLEMRQITNGIVDEFSPTWAPAGNALAFVRVQDDVRDLFAIYFAR